jgi:hypothetical protein
MRNLYEEAVLGIIEGMELFADFLDRILSIAWNYKWELLTLCSIYAILNW